MRTCDIGAISSPGCRFWRCQPIGPARRSGARPCALASVAVPRAVRQALEALARSEGVTIFMLLLAAFLALLRRYTGEDDVAVGTVDDPGNRPELDPLIGLFVNTLVLRTDLSGDPTVPQVAGARARRRAGASRASGRSVRPNWSPS